MLIILRLVMLVVLIPLGVYLYFTLMRAAEFWGLSRQNKWVRIGVILVTCFAVGISTNIFGTPAMVVLHLVAVAAVMQFLNFIVKFVYKRRKKLGEISKETMNRGVRVWDGVYRCGLVPILVTTLIISYGFFNMSHIIETDYTIHTEKSIRSDGYRVAMLSDLHFGTTMDEEKLQDKIHDMEKKNPDILVLCGDIFDDSTTYDQMKNVCRIVGKAKTKSGTYYVFGNHDGKVYGKTQTFGVNEIREELKANGVHVMEDEVARLGEHFVLVGRRDRGFSGDGGRKSMSDLLKEHGAQTVTGGAASISKDDFILLLDHQPVELQDNAKLGVDLQLSGHTHGGQIWPVGLMIDYLGFGEMNYGYRKIDTYQIIVSSGIAGWGYPIRTGKHSEYLIIDIKK